MQRADWVMTVIVAAFVLLFLWGGIAALRRARRRRLEEFRETTEEELASRAEQQRLLRETEAAEELEKPAPAAAPLAAATEAPAEEAEAALERAPSEAPAVPAPARPQDEALKQGLVRTSKSFRERLAQVFGRHPQVDPEALDELEEALLLADVGVTLTSRFMTRLRADLKANKLSSRRDVEEALKSQMREALKGGESVADPFAASPDKPKVILFVGVNGVGKTTTIGKLAALARGRGLSVVLAAGDTFRAAAVEQLGIWAERSGARLVRGEANSDPASVIFNAIESGRASEAALVLADTAGRLHTKTALMDEIKKVKRSAGKARQGAPDETWLVVDATTGQNAMQQAREFHQALGLTGIILTKLDGTAKGGVVIAIAEALRLPVCFVGVGEKPEDLRPFDAETFVSAMFAP
jgi:fused signal recognition particle receptor